MIGGGHRGLEGRDRVGVVALGAREGEPVLLGVPEERRAAIGTGGSQADLEQLVEGCVGVPAARDRANGSEEEGVRGQGRPIIRRGEVPSIERAIESPHLTAPIAARQLRGRAHARSSALAHLLAAALRSARHRASGPRKAIRPAIYSGA